MTTTFWIIRHCEREDNINDKWMEKSTLNSDNSPLSARGRKQADELRKRFENEVIDHVISSPFDRCLETATRLIGKRNIPIKVEPGIVEALYLCETPPGYESLEEISKIYPLVDPTYYSVMPWNLKMDGIGDNACIGRIRETLKRLGENFAGTNMLLVSHGSPIGAMHYVSTKAFKYVGQATVSKLLLTEDDTYFLQLSNDASHLSDKSNLRPY